MNYITHTHPKLLMELSRQSIRRKTERPERGEDEKVDVDASGS